MSITWLTIHLANPVIYMDIVEKIVIVNLPYRCFELRPFLQSLRSVVGINGRLAKVGQHCALKTTTSASSTTLHMLRNGYVFCSIQSVSGSEECHSVRSASSVQIRNPLAQQPSFRSTFSFRRIAALLSFTTFERACAGLHDSMRLS